MKRVLQRLAAPNTWIAVFALLAAAGSICLLVGGLTKSPLLGGVGFWLLVPFLGASLLVAVVVIPLLLVVRIGRGGSPGGRERPDAAKEEQKEFFGRRTP